MYFPLEVLNQQILSQHPSYLVLSALLEQPFPEFHKAHGNQDLISYLPGKIPIMSSHWCKKSDIKTGSVVISIPAPGDSDVLLKRKAKNQIFCLFTTFLLFTQDVRSYFVYIYFNCNLPIGMGEDLLGEHEIQDKILRYCTCGLWSILMVNTQMGQLGMLPISYRTASWWKNTHTHR